MQKAVDAVRLLITLYQQWVSILGTLAILGAMPALTPSGIHSASDVLSSICSRLSIPTEAWLAPAQYWIAAHQDTVGVVACCLFLGGLIAAHGSSAIYLRSPATCTLGAVLLLELSPSAGTWAVILSAYVARLLVERLLQHTSAGEWDWQGVFVGHMVGWRTAPISAGAWLLGHASTPTSIEAQVG
jgi:hypothetical protein